MPADKPITTLQRFFTGLAEQTFQVKLGVVDPPLIDYLSELLVRFVRCDQIHRVRSQSGQVVRELNRMLAEAETRIGIARRTIHRHIGDFALFWAGLFPEHLRLTHGDADLDRFGEYCVHGKRAYLIASSIETDADDAAPSEVLQRLGLEFEMCAYGLREVSREWEQPDRTPSPSLSP